MPQCTESNHPPVKPLPRIGAPSRNPEPRRGRLCAVSTVVLLCVGIFALPAHAGALFQPFELLRFVWFAESGQEPFADTRERLVEDANRPWAFGYEAGLYRTTVAANGQKSCHPESDPYQTDYLKDGASDVYAKALAYQTTYESKRNPQWAIDAREHLLRLASTHGFHGPDGKDFSGSNQCVLDLAVSVPMWISAAELLQGAGVWSWYDRYVFSLWLQGEVYPRVAWASRVRRNNWGAAGSLAARMIARYVAPLRPRVSEISPVQRHLNASDAVVEHDEMQRLRMGTDWQGDSSCSVHGIQSHGGIPDELRRGAGGCLAQDLPSDRDSGHGYQTMHVTFLAMHAEILRREGDISLFEQEASPGTPALLQAMLFVIDNQSPGGRSWNWGVRTGVLRVADRYYHDPRVAQQILVNEPRGFRGGRSFPYTQVHPEAGP